MSRLFFRRGFVFRGRVSPRRATCFLLLRQKKVGKEKATLLSVSLRFATGNLRCSAQEGVRRTRFAQTAAALIPPAPALLGTARREWGVPSLRSALGLPGWAFASLGGGGWGGADIDWANGINDTTGTNATNAAHGKSTIHSTSAPSTTGSAGSTRNPNHCPPSFQALQARSARSALEAERSDGPQFCNPLWLRRGAQRFADKGRSCLSEASSADPAKREHRRLPRSAAKGSQTAGSPFLCLLSFGEAKESESAAGPRPGPGKQALSMLPEGAAR
ncbi:hypothetical protein FHY06_002443 [Variovorax sp. BK613]|nr:hypothetical protein [Variovorax sp. BK613]